ncbi:TonB C-terminal domain-containing protein [Sphingomonas sp. XMGL2]|uniref:TonB C-terminal domain-containing protein n=2 Tax=Sphingomonas quercus TaxID=2842451 RepID=A0ABS6BEY2_9SPHN|nr:TonB C-terminal domain-containing protein [Sphingomonas quercus]
MDRAERTGLGLSVAGHVALFAALSLGLFAARNKMPSQNQPLDVMFVDEVGLTAAAPKASNEAAAPSVAPEQGKPEEAAAPPEAAAPAPSPPEPQAAPPKPAPKPEPKPEAEKPAPAKPTPAAKPVPKPSPKPLGADFLKSIKTQAASEGKSASADTNKAKGARLGPDFLKGLGAAQGKANTPPAPMSGVAQASLAAAIREQLARYWVPPSGPIGALRTSLRVHLNPDGSIAGRPEVIGQDGINDSNRSYARQHADAAIRTVYKAAPLKLPPDLYDYWKLLEPLNFDATLER